MNILSINVPFFILVPNAKPNLGVTCVKTDRQTDPKPFVYKGITEGTIFEECMLLYIDIYNQEEYGAIISIQLLLFHI